MLPLAQLTPEQLGPIGPWLIVASVVLFLVNQALNFYKEHMREQPAPRDTYATKEELRQTHGRISRERDEVNRNVAAAEAIARAAADRIDGEVKAISAAFADSVAQIRRDGEGRVTGLEQKIDTLRDDIAKASKAEADTLHERITELLAKTSEMRGEVKHLLAKSS